MVDPTKPATGLLVIEAAMSNLNGDPDRESDPRTLETAAGEFGLVSDVSIKRKVRDMVLFKEGPIWQHISKSLGISAEGFDLLERPDRNRVEIGALTATEFLSRFWDARIFGSNLLVESASKKTSKGKDKMEGDETKADGQGISRTYAGPVAFSWGKTLAPVSIIRATCTNISPVQEGKSRGMAPESYRVVEHALRCPIYLFTTQRTQDWRESGRPGTDATTTPSHRSAFFTDSPADKCSSCLLCPAQLCSRFRGSA